MAFDCLHVHGLDVRGLPLHRRRHMLEQEVAGASIVCTAWPPPSAAGPRRRATKKVENATAVIWKTLLIAERTFRRLDAPELLPEVAESVTFVDGVRASRPRQPRPGGGPPRERR
jgi:hypothetical protein